MFTLKTNYYTIMWVTPFSFVQSNLVFISTDITFFTGVMWGALVGDSYKLVICAEFELNWHSSFWPSKQIFGLGNFLFLSKAGKNSRKHEAYSLWYQHGTVVHCLFFFLNKFPVQFGVKYIMLQAVGTSRFGYFFWFWEVILLKWVLQIR